MAEKLGTSLMLSIFEVLRVRLSNFGVGDFTYPFGIVNFYAAKTFMPMIVATTATT